MLPCIVLALGIFGILYKLLRALFSPLRRVPGPFLARFSHAWYFREAYHGRVHSTSIRLHEKYGKIPGNLGERCIEFEQGQLFVSRRTSSE